MTPRPLLPKPVVTRIEDREGRCIRSGESALVTPADCNRAILRGSPISRPGPVLDAAQVGAS